MSRLHDLDRLYWQGFKDLAVGDLVPPHLYISDYTNGVVPAWRVLERVDAAMLLFVLVDGDNGDVRVFLLISTTRALRSPQYIGEEKPGQLCDLYQQHRKWRMTPAYAVCIRRPKHHAPVAWTPKPEQLSLNI